MMTTWWCRISRSVLITLWLGLLMAGAPPAALGGNVLAVYPHFGFSHFKVVMPILNELARRGHNLTVISYVKHPQAEQWPNYEQLLISQPGEDQSSTTINLVPLTEHTPTRSLGTLFREYYSLHSEGQKTCERLYASGHVETVFKRHQTQPYDLLLTEYFNSDCQLALAKLMNLPIIGLSTCALMPYYYDRIDLPDTPSFIQSEFVGFAGALSWDERLVNFIQAKVLKLLYRYHSNRADNALVSRHLGIEVDVDEVARTQTAFIFGNQHYSLMGSRPQSLQFVEVGGVHLTSQAAQELPANIAQFIDQSEVPIIFFSWGSMVRISSIDEDKLAAIVEALERQPLRVIWKWEAEEKPKLDADKFLFVKWAPQLALLCHPKVELFWAHGGLLGTTESVHCGKPMLVTPIYGDQFLNAFSVQNRGMGLKLDYQDISVKNVSEALKTLSNPNYATRSVGISKIFSERQNSPLESAVWCVEHVIQHGLLAAEMLQSPGIELKWYVYHSLDSVCLIIVVLLALAYSLYHFSSGRPSKPYNNNRRRKSKRS
ncbi:UDP-glucuronosyltransferase 1-3 [Drosophila guanche]|uniref:Blast:UDP-glucuronosyltransferase 2B1 n=1 Tax=Drosophila guanche TaxID=7266 RepID=A0A3B0JEK4_DROGU|nr:UDP-glucuronosyltransferase 1-3 [Drosophila guanche]SPP79083.1 blast:UDP-glucuronosyltransferase 2B1 [Drosophila guanche]